MKVWGIWYGGPCYTLGEAEKFPSVKAAREVFAARADGRDPVSGNLTPCVSRAEASMLLYAADPEEAADAYPSAELTFGPRGGVRQSAC